jgi:hypothetical protein
MNKHVANGTEVGSLQELREPGRIGILPDEEGSKSMRAIHRTDEIRNLWEMCRRAENKDISNLAMSCGST